MSELDKELFIGLGMKQGFHELTSNHVVKATVEIAVDDVRSGLIDKVGGVTNFGVLMSLLGHLNEEGKSFPSIKTVMADTGIKSNTTVGTAIKELEQVTVDGQPLFIKEKTSSGTGSHSRNTYIFNLPEIVPEVVGNEDYMSSQQILDYFCLEYERVFDMQYIQNVGQMLPKIQENLQGKYDDVELQGIITIAVEQYEKHWAKPQFPYPSIGQLCTWLATEAQKIIKAEEKEDKQLEKRIEQAEKTEAQVDPVDMLDMY